MTHLLIFAAFMFICAVDAYRRKMYGFFIGFTLMAAADVYAYIHLNNQTVEEVQPCE